MSGCRAHGQKRETRRCDTGVKTGSVNKELALGFPRGKRFPTL